MAMTDVLSTLIDLKYKKSLMDKAKDERIPLSQKIRGTTEPEFREDFEIPFGPMTRPQNTALDLVSAERSGVPASLQGFNASEYKDITQGNENLRPKTPAVTPDEFDRRANERFLFQQKAADAAEQRKARFIPPKIKMDYQALDNNLNLANNIKSGLEHAINTGLDVTGILASPVNKFKEVIGTLPPEEQQIITDLRLNFADFVRERGGTAFTETEKMVFGPIMPEMNKDEKTNLNRINRMIDILNDKKSGFQSQFQGLGESPQVQQFTPSQPNKDKKIAVINPQGIEGMIPLSQLVEALKSGYKRK